MKAHYYGRPLSEKDHYEIAHCVVNMGYTFEDLAQHFDRPESEVISYVILNLNPYVAYCQRNQAKKAAEADQSKNNPPTP